MQQDVENLLGGLPPTVADSSGSGLSIDWQQVRQTRSAQAVQIIGEVAALIDPANQTHSIAVMDETCIATGGIFAAAYKANGDALASVSAAEVAAAVSNILAPYGTVTVTPNDNTWNGGYSNPYNDAWITMYNTVLQFFATNGVTLG